MVEDPGGRSQQPIAHTEDNSEVKLVFGDYFDGYTGIYPTGLAL